MRAWAAEGDVHLLLGLGRALVRTRATSGCSSRLQPAAVLNSGISYYNSSAARHGPEFSEPSTRVETRKAENETRSDALLLPHCSSLRGKIVEMREPRRESAKICPPRSGCQGWTGVAFRGNAVKPVTLAVGRRS
ncbi:unnamed protein product [Symbiodinium sp. CCMP2592]|nr:unnamed protein product [Symbiodinium sp. CCMP2592]